MALTSPLRALLEAHLQASWNRSRKDLGEVGSVAFVVLLVLSLLIGVVPLVFGALAAGYLLGASLPGPEHIRTVGGVLTGLVVLGALLGGSRALSWESTRVFPVRLKDLFAAELLAGLGDLLPLYFTLLTGCLLLGVAAARPLLLLLVPFPFLLTVASLLVLRQLFGCLQDLVVKRLQLTLAVLGIAGTVAAAVQDVLQLSLPGLAVVLRAVERTLDALPLTWSVQAFDDALAGRWGLALARQLYPLAVLALLLLATARLLQREADPQRRRSPAKEGRERLWSFSTATRGVARLQLDLLLRSHVGKFGLVLVPLFAFGTTLLLSRTLPAGHDLRRTPLAVGLGYLALGTIGLQLNQFGFDGPGVKSLLLLPIRPIELLRGKALGLLAFCGLQATLFLALDACTGSLRALDVLSGFFLFASLVAYQQTLGQWTSLWVPMRVPMAGVNSRTKFHPVVLVSPLVAVAGSALITGIYALVARLPSLPSFALLTALLAFLVTVNQLSLPFAARWLEGRREELVKALG